MKKNFCYVFEKGHNSIVCDTLEKSYRNMFLGIFSRFYWFKYKKEEPFSLFYYTDDRFVIYFENSKDKVREKLKKISEYIKIKLSSNDYTEKIKGLVLLNILEDSVIYSTDKYNKSCNKYDLNSFSCIDRYINYELYRFLFKKYQTIIDEILI